MNLINFKQDLYLTLGVKRGSSWAVIERGYKAKREKLRHFHTQCARKRLEEIKQAANVLLSAELKVIYDKLSERSSYIFGKDDGGNEDTELSSPVNIVHRAKNSSSTSTAHVSNPEFSRYWYPDFRPKAYLGTLKDFKDSAVDDYMEKRRETAVAKHAWQYHADPAVRNLAGDSYEVLAAQTGALQARKQRVTKDFADHKERARRLKLHQQKRNREAKSAQSLEKMTKTLERRVDRRQLGDLPRSRERRLGG